MTEVIETYEEKRARAEAEWRAAYVARIDAAIVAACGDTVEVNVPGSDWVGWRRLTSKADPAMVWTVTWRFSPLRASYMRAADREVTEVAIEGPRIPRSRGRYGAAKMVARTPERLMARAAEFIRGRSVEELIDEATIGHLRRLTETIDDDYPIPADHRAPAVSYLRMLAEAHPEVLKLVEPDDSVHEAIQDNRKWFDARLARVLTEFMVRESAEAEKRLARRHLPGDAD